LSLVREATLQEPDNTEIWRFFSQLLLYSNLLEEAEESARRAVFLDPDYDKAYGNLAKVLARRERYEEAIEAVDKALELSPGNPEYHDIAIRCYIDLRRWRAAEDTAKDALFWAPEDEDCLVTYAWLCLLLGENEKARSLTEQVLSLYPESSGGRRVLARIEKKSGNLVEAERLYREVVETDPECSTSREIYEKIRKELDQSEHGSLGPFYDPVTNKFLRRI
jgi:tetratricopeptide (TPR) repeat protein